ncbi:MAG TPA: TonB-dependent receptor, partial [Bryobacteraceae bacterium]
MRYTFSRNRNLASPYFAFRNNVAADLGISGPSQDPADWGPPNLSFQNFTGLSDGNSSLSRNQTSSFGESVIWIRGVHNLTFGFDYRRQQINRNSDPNGRGTFGFTGLLTASPDGKLGTGFDLADFLLGFTDTSALRYGNTNLYFRTH